MKNHFPKILVLLLLFSVLFLAACGGTAPAAEQEIVVFAAASLTDAFTEIARDFEAQHPEATVLLNFAGSSQLAAQLVEGVPADVFASANAAQMQVVIEAGRIAATAPTPFVSNRLTIIVPADNPAGITALEDLVKPDVKLVVAVQGVPVRQYTDEVVARSGDAFATDFYNNVVSEEENVRQVSAKIALGEADAGIVYTSDVKPDLTDQVIQIEIPAAQNVIATYPIALLSDAPHPELAQQFMAFVQSAAGQAILARWGFGPPAQ